MSLESILSTSVTTLSEDETHTFTKILEGVATTSNNDPCKSALVLTMLWYVMHRRRRLEQHAQRRQHFKRKIQLFKTLRMKMQQKQRDPSGDFWTLLLSDDLDPDKYLKYFHMRRETFNYLFKEIGELLRKSNTSMRESLHPKKRLAATLYRLATNAEYLKVAGLFGIGKSTTTSLVRDVCEVIVNHFKDREISLVGGEGVIGAIDVFISSSTFSDLNGENEPSPFFSKYSESHSIIFQAVVDPCKGTFMDVCAGKPGGLSNIEALKSSDLQARVEGIGAGPCPPLTVVGDESYQSSPWISSPSSLSDEVFETAVTKVKSRWKIFHGKNGKINFNADAFQNIAIACCILHNICERREDVIDPLWGEDVPGFLFLRRGQERTEG